MLVPLPEVVEKILGLTQGDPSVEHCGIYTDAGEVIELRNVSEEPHNSYRLDEDEVVELFNHRDDLHLTNMGVWHTHPDGMIGPSREDLQMKIEKLNYLVVTIPTGETAVF